MTPFLDDLRWRYATKAFDPTKKLSATQLQDLLESLRLTPTSFGLQPYRFIVVKDPSLRERIREHAWNQSQVTDASHLIALCAKTSMSDADIDAYVSDIAKTRNVPPASLSGYRDMMKGYVLQRTPEEVKEWLMRQSYIALGILMAACASLRIDSCPMEGFDREKVNELLELPGTGFTISTLCPVGFRSTDDAHATLPKVRYPLTDLAEER